MHVRSIYFKIRKVAIFSIVEGHFKGSAMGSTREKSRRENVIWSIKIDDIEIFLDKNSYFKIVVLGAKWYDYVKSG